MVFSSYYNGYRPAVAVKDPELVKMILVKDFPNFTDRPVCEFVPCKSESMCEIVSVLSCNLAKAAEKTSFRNSFKLVKEIVLLLTESHDIFHGMLQCKMYMHSRKELRAFLY